MAINWHEIAGWVAGSLSLAAFVPYVIAILRREMTPNRATWLIWTVVGAMIVRSYDANGATHTMWLAISYVVGPFIVFILSIKHGEGGWTRLDIACLLTAGASAVVWLLSGSAFLALVMLIVADAMGATPTIIKSYKRPESEDRTAWTIGFSATVVNLFAIENWNSLSITMHPVYMFVATGIILSLLWFGPSVRKKLPVSQS